jgi:predicted RNase H-like HicB family nuclease
MEYQIETEREDDGRWLAEVVNAPVNGILAYGKTPELATAAAMALSERVLAERREQTKPHPSST